MSSCKKCAREIGNYPFCPMCGAAQKGNQVTLCEIYSDWRAVYFRKIGRKGKEGYENAWKTLSVLGQSQIQELTIQDYQIVVDLLKSKSLSLQQKLLQLIGQICKYAAANRIEVINPTPYLVLEGSKGESREIFSDEEISRLFLYAESGGALSNDAKIVLVLIFTGLRPEELFEVKTEDVELIDNCIYTLGSKTEAGRKRIVPLISQIMPFVLDFYSQKGSRDYLILSPKGCRVNLGNWRKRKFYPLMNELEINTPDDPHRLVPYSCRHTYASLADRAGVDREALIKLIGHTSYKFTKRVYIHEKLPQLAAEVQKIDQLVQNELITKGNGKDGLSW